MSHTANQQDFALVVGINHYPEYESLRGAIDDAKEIQAWLLDEKGGGLLPDHCHLILSQPHPLIPYQQQIDEKLVNIYRKSREMGGRRFYFYFSGHGLGTELDDNALCLAAWSELFRNNALSSRDYLHLIVNTGIFEEVIFLLDCCRNRLIGHQGLTPTLGWPRPDEGAGLAKKFVAYATQFQDSAYEEERGHFHTALISALKGAAANEGGHITAGMLKNYLEVETSRIAKQYNHLQEARVTSDFTEKELETITFGPVIKIHIPCKITFSPARTGMIRLENKHLDVIREDAATAGPWEIDLEPGLNVLTDIDSGEEKTIRVKPSAEVIHVEF